jgi:hypothetical protein
MSGSKTKNSPKNVKRVGNKGNKVATKRNRNKR